MKMLYVVLTLKILKISYTSICACIQRFIIRLTIIGLFLSGFMVLNPFFS